MGILPFSLKYELEVLSPLNIGDGNSYRKFEYITKNGTVGFIDVLKLLKSNERNTAFMDYFYKTIGDRNFNWQDALKYAPKVDLEKYISYRVNVCGTSKVKGDVISFIKTGGKPYIPGSSLKGAFRSGLTRGVWSLIEKEYKKGIEDKLNKKDVKLKDLDNKAEEDIFGKPHYSPFRFVCFSDSIPLSVETLGIYEMKILNICNGRAKWFRGNENVDDSEGAKSIFVEALMPKSKAEGFFELKNDKNSWALNEVKNSWILQDAFEKIKSDALKYIENERAFYEKYGLDRVADFYRELQKLHERLEKSEILLQVGFGTGYLAKTIGRFLSTECLKAISQKGMKVSDLNLFPKTRRIIFEDGVPAMVPGWVKIKFGEIS